MGKNKGATPGAILSATTGATPRQHLVNGGATHTPYTPSVAPALGGWVHASVEVRPLRNLTPSPPNVSAGTANAAGPGGAFCESRPTWPP